MTDTLEAYPAMKASGLPWLGEVPASWEQTRLKRILRPVDRRSTTGTETLLSLRRDHGVVVYSDHFSRPPQGATTVGFKLVRHGQLVVNRLQANNGLVFHSRLEGLVSPDYSVLEATRPVLMEYVSRLLRTDPYRTHFRRESTGLGTGSAGFLRLYDDRLLQTAVALPSISEQAAILRFLDHADRRIRRYVRAKQNLIVLLEEQKQVIIHDAVTRGLDPNVRLKPSGVEWLRDVPEHWEVLPLRRVTVARCDGPFGSGLKSSHYSTSGITVVRLQNIGHGYYRNSSAVFISPDYYATLGDHDVRAGDLLIAGLGDERHPAGRACVAPTSITPAMVKADCFRFRLSSRVDPDFAALHLTATAAAASAVLSTGATRQRTNLQSTAARAICLPAISEQRSIVAWIEGSTASLRTAVERAGTEVLLLQEFRTRLTADVVTGKIDVREMAARLPEDADEAESMNDADEVVEGEDVDVAVSDEPEA